MTEYQDKQIVVVGAGSSGRGMARYFREAGAFVILSDHRSDGELGDLSDLERYGVALDLGGHSKELFVSADLVAISPGVPLTVPAIEAAIQNEVPVFGEIEVAFRALDAPMIAITGTNGKSTVTTLMGAMFEASAKRTFLGGNLGTPLIDAVGGEWDWLVVELSSFQLESIERFRPRYGVLLNITEDHLDRYPDMESYRAAKGRLFENMTADDVIILNADDPLVMSTAADCPARRVCFSSSRSLDEGMSLVDGLIVWRHGALERQFDPTELKLKGEHNLENVMAALIPPLLEGCPAETLWASACSYTGLPHRMEHVAEINGVDWYDDSKGTNIGSVVKSLNGLEQPVTLIAGGKDKQGDLNPLVAVVKEKVEHLILIGEAAERMAETLAGAAEIHRVDSLDAAVETAAAVTVSGGTVLLSPGCSSFDMFRSFEERGRQFAAAVRQLESLRMQDHGS